jgi:coenzyme F420 hydrogenase subunit beta
MFPKTTLKQLEDNVMRSELCTQCGACVNICPYFVAYQDRILSLHHCNKQTGACVEICPRTPTDLDRLRNKLFDFNDMTSEIGAVKGFYITRSTDRQIRKSSQHGGTVTTLMKLALEEGIVDSAVLAQDKETLLPDGVGVSDPEDVERLAKTKFVASPNVAAFHMVSQKNAERIGVVATPCQALALAKMRTSQTPRIQEASKKLHLVIGLFCGWAFSWENLKSKLAERVPPESIMGMDVPPSQYHSLRVTTKEGVMDISLDELRDGIRSSCQYCFDLTAEFSDISVGSARLPEGWEAAQTWNHVIVRTGTGMNLLDLAKSKGLLEFHDVPAGNLTKLKQAASNKKKRALQNLKGISGSENDFVYLSADDSALSQFK